MERNRGGFNVVLHGKHVAEVDHKLAVLLSVGYVRVRAKLQLVTVGRDIRHAFEARRSGSERREVAVLAKLECEATERVDIYLVVGLAIEWEVESESDSTAVAHIVGESRSDFSSAKESRIAVVGKVGSSVEVGESGVAKLVRRLSERNLELTVGEFREYVFERVFTLILNLECGGRRLSGNVDIAKLDGRRLYDDFGRLDCHALHIHLKLDSVLACEGDASRVGSG